MHINPSSIVLGIAHMQNTDGLDKVTVEAGKKLFENRKGVPCHFVGHM